MKSTKCSIGFERFLLLYLKQENVGKLYLKVCLAGWRWERSPQSRTKLNCRWVLLVAGILRCFVHCLSLVVRLAQRLEVIFLSFFQASFQDHGVVENVWAAVADQSIVNSLIAGNLKKLDDIHQKPLVCSSNSSTHVDSCKFLKRFRLFALTIEQRCHLKDSDWFHTNATMLKVVWFSHLELN